jgi:hypothetical protein
VGEAAMTTPILVRIYRFIVTEQRLNPTRSWTWLDDAHVHTTIGVGFILAIAFLFTALVVR